MKFFCTLLILTTSLFSQEKTPVSQEVTVSEFLKGALYLPENTKKPNLVIIIAGSGPTDRDGNQPGLTNNSLKYLAEGIAKQNIAAFSYDKRFLTEMKAGITPDETKLSFDNFINDAIAVFNYFKNTGNYNKIAFAGHSEGSLIGMVATEKVNADGFISIAGTGNSIDFVLQEQIAQQAPFLLEETKTILASLKKGETTEIKNPNLQSIFRKSVQPYMISWIKYNPSEEIKKINKPVLIVNGTKDIQIKVSEAELLKQAKPEAKLVLINDMSHVFKDVNNGDGYKDPSIPIMPQLVTEITSFVNKL